MSDPFFLLGLEETFFLDSTVLEKAYFEAQRHTHPDRFTHATPERKADAARHATIINQAYLVLKDPLKRAALLLKKASVEPLSSDPEFLMQVMEWREAQAEGKDISQELADQQARLSQDLEDAFREKNYELANKCVYRLIYLQGLSKPPFSRSLESHMY